MFTGIIEDIGQVIRIGKNTLVIKTKLQNIKLGDSISINGICLTAASVPERNTILFDFSPETRNRTNLRSLKSKDFVNIERALKIGESLGGHFITGHAEGTEKILKISKSDNSNIFSLSMSDYLANYIVPKGSVGIDGISLTVAAKTSKTFSVSVIPHTLKNTTLGFKKTGDVVNIEPDILAKYIENIIGTENKGISFEFLKDNGF